MTQPNNNFAAGEGRTVQPFLDANRSVLIERLKEERLKAAQRDRRASRRGIDDRHEYVRKAEDDLRNAPTKAFRLHDTTSNIGLKALAGTLINRSSELAGAPLHRVTNGVKGAQNPGMAGAIAYGNVGRFEVRGTVSQKNLNRVYAKMNVHPLVEQVLDMVEKNGQKGNGHGRCAEIVAISDLMWSMDPTGKLTGPAGLTKAQHEFEKRSAVTIAHSRVIDPPRERDDPYPKQTAAVDPCETCARVTRALAIATVPRTLANVPPTQVTVPQREVNRITPERDVLKRMERLEKELAKLDGPLAERRPEGKKREDPMMGPHPKREKLEGTLIAPCLKGKKRENLMKGPHHPKKMVGFANGMGGVQPTAQGPTLT